MAGRRKVHTAAFKAQVALAALKGDRTVNELAGHYGVHPTLIHGWKKQLLSGAEGIFGSPAQAASADAEARQAELFEQIGRLTMELEWLKKKLPSSCEHKRPLIEVGHPALSGRRQCELLGLSRSSLYYEPAGETPEDLRLMRLIDERYTACPFYGSRRMTIWLTERGEEVSRKRVRRLMRLMGLEALYPKPRLSLAGKGHRIYPYLLRGVKIVRPDQVWSTDTTYVPMASGFTTSLALAWALAEIVPRPEVVDRITHELRQVAGGGAPEAEHLPALDYLDAAIRESLRLRPVAPFVVRKTMRPSAAGGREYPAGVVLRPCSYLVHRRDDLYPEPDRFRPERFLGRKFGPHEWFPFGGGNRVCLGMPFALYEMKALLATLFSQARLARPAGARSRARRYGIVLGPDDGARLIVRGATA